MPAINDYSIGNDPELFLTQKGKVIPAETYFPYLRIVSGGKYYHDNIALEISPYACTCVMTEMNYFKQILESISKEAVVRGLSFSLRAAERIPLVDINKFKSLQTFGCKPSFIISENNEVVMQRPKADPLTTPIRSIGFHIHLGHYTKPDYLTDPIQAAPLVKLFDCFVGLPGVLVDRDPRCTWRRKMLGYGRASEFRIQPHGIEYRTLGPWPLIHPAWFWWANASARNCLHIYTNYKQKCNNLVENLPYVEIQNAINDNSLTRAKALWLEIKKQFVKSDIPFLLSGSATFQNPDHTKYFDFLSKYSRIKQMSPAADFIKNWCKANLLVHGTEWVVPGGFKKWAIELCNKNPSLSDKLDGYNYVRPI